MKKVLLMILPLLYISCSKKQDQVQEKLIEVKVISETISNQEFQNKMLAAQNAVLLDVRTPEEFDQGYIDGAINIDFRASDFQSKISDLDKDATYFVYCASGGRSRSAADMMKELKFKEVYDLAGGFKGWSNSGLPYKMPTE